MAWPLGDRREDMNSEVAFRRSSEIFGPTSYFVKIAHTHLFLLPFVYEQDLHAVSILVSEPGAEMQPSCESGERQIWPLVLATPLLAISRIAIWRVQK